MLQAIAKWYAGLPTWGKALATTVEGAAAGFAIQYFSNPGWTPCFTASCLRGFAIGMAGAIVIAVRNWVKQSPLAAAMEQPAQTPQTPSSDTTTTK